MSDEELFPGHLHGMRLPMPDADVVLWHSPDLGASPEHLLERLITDTAWREETVTLWGRTYLQPRLIAWHGDEGGSYVYSGTRFEPQPWTPLLLDLRRRVEAVAGARFNSVLLNFYRDHRDSVAMHSDHERELGTEPVIASLTLGEPRTFVMRHKFDKTLKPWRLPLPSGSLLLMKGPTQHFWQHGVPKRSRPCGPRVNLTLRRVVTASR